MQPFLMTFLPIFLLVSQPLAVFAGSPASGLRISGIVSDETGAQVAGASLLLFSEERVVQARSDENGHFVFSDVSPGTFEMEISYPGFITGRLDSIRLADREIAGISVILHVGQGSGPCVIGLKGSDLIQGSGTSYETRTDEANLRGVILGNEGKPLSNVTAAISGAGQTRVTMSTEHGEIIFAGLEPGKYTLRVSHEGYVSGLQKLWITRQNLTRVRFLLFPETPCGLPQ